MIGGPDNEISAGRMFLVSAHIIKLYIRGKDTFAWKCEGKVSLLVDMINQLEEGYIIFMYWLKRYIR